METLENICRAKLEIGKNISIRKIIKFANENEGQDLRSFFIINFRNKIPKKLTYEDYPFIYDWHHILGFSKKYGKYGIFYELYCKVEGEKYVKIFSNKKLNESIEETESEIIHNFCPIIYKTDECISFFPGSLKEYKNITYRNIIFY